MLSKLFQNPNIKEKIMNTIQNKENYEIMYFRKSDENMFASEYQKNQNPEK